jgi:hypothetical protein
MIITNLQIGSKNIVTDLTTEDTGSFLGRGCACREFPPATKSLSTKQNNSNRLEISYIVATVTAVSKKGDIKISDNVLRSYL